MHRYERSLLSSSSQRFNSNLDMAIDNILQMMFQYFKLSDASVSYSVSVDDVRAAVIPCMFITIAPILYSLCLILTFSRQRTSSS